MTRRVELTLRGSPFAGATGRGVRVAIVDSGVAVPHPHVPGVAGGIHIRAAGPGTDYADRIGHGTAVTAAIHEKAPAAALVAVRVFERTLATTADVLARAIEWAVADGAHLINVSLGSPNVAHRDRLLGAIATAQERGVFVVAARARDEDPMLPGVLPGVIGVMADASIDRETLVAETHDAGGLVLRAAPFPRPIPGLPVERNLQGVSFSVANATGFLARLREAAPDVTSSIQLQRLLLSD